MASAEAEHNERPTLRDMGLAAAGLALAITMAWSAVNRLQQDLAYTALETELSFWGREHYLPTAATRARSGRELAALLSSASDHPDYLALAAYRYSWLAYWEDDPSAALPYAVQAVNAQFAAQQMRPAYRQGWAKMVGYARRAVGDEGVAALSGLAQQRLDALATDMPPAPPT